MLQGVDDFTHPLLVFYAVNKDLQILYILIKNIYLQ